MEISGKISKRQTALAVCSSTLGTIVYTFTDVTLEAGRSFWVATLLGVCLNIPFAVWILVLGSYKQDGTLFDLMEDGIGKIANKCMIVIYYIINIALAVCMLNLFSGSIKVYFLPRTPTFVIVVLFVVIGAVFANSGLKYCIMIISILGAAGVLNYYLGFSLPLLNEFNMEYVTPVFDVSAAQFLKGVFITAGNQAECLLFVMIIVGNIPQKKEHYFAVVKGILAWAVLLSFAILIMESIVSKETLSHVAEAGMTVGSDIQIGFLSGLEIFVFITYQCFTILKTTIYIYCCWTAFKKLFNVPRGKPILIISALLMIVITTWLNSYNKAYYYSLFLGNYIIPAFVIIVLLLGTISVFIKKHKEGKNA